MANETYDNFESLKARLDEIMEAVADSELSLDDALTLYEEAVSLGLRATDLLEENIAEADAVKAETDAQDNQVSI
ncbi:exodeoxyribonuclease VII small subunit [Eggerthellaceae bacterium 3-80]|nr:exodeoxyribonuclease VII small subunit [bacterium D16-34]